MGRKIGLDVGDVRIGVAVSDPLGIISQPHSVIKRTTLPEDLKAIADLVVEREADTIVVGMPLDREGKPGPQAQKVMDFMEQLRAVTPAEIVAQDERFTTAMAERMMIDADVRRRDRRKSIDKIAAQNILQTWLDRRKKYL